MSSRDVSHDVSPSPTTARLLLLVSALRKESMVAHQLLESYRLLLGKTRHVMGRRLLLKATKGRLVNTCDKATIEGMVAELDKLEKLYSPHMAPNDEDGRVRGSLRDEVDVLKPGEERGRNHGPLCADTDVRGPKAERGRNDGSLHDKADAPRPEEEQEDLEDDEGEEEKRKIVTQLCDSAPAHIATSQIVNMLLLFTSITHTG